MSNPFWQKMDFGFRAHLFGRSIMLDTTFRVEYRSAHPTEDQTVDQDYPWFYAKNLAIRVGREGVSLPPLRVIPFSLQSGVGLVKGIQLFRDARRWLKENGNRYVRDPRDLVREWDVNQE
jgi:hypothetical protein